MSPRSTRDSVETLIPVFAAVRSRDHSRSRRSFRRSVFCRPTARILLTSIPAVKQILLFWDEVSKVLKEWPLRAQNRFATTSRVLNVIWTLGDVVRKLRSDRGWNQGQLADAAGLHPTAVLNLEKRSDRSERSTIERVARALEVSVADLYAYAEEASLSAELSEAERRSVMLFQRRLIAKRQRPPGAQPIPSRRSDPPDQAREYDAPVQKRRHK